ncbi:MAG: nucleotidyl transferase AbiEii/AbiGii toxin family protein [Steroidobacteraceae bacterium]
MPKPAFKRSVHRQVRAILSRLDAAFLERARCYFAGGTRIALELGEYRESRDIDFLCSDRDGYRTLRETATAQSLGAMVAGKLEFARSVRADQYGIRTIVSTNGAGLKLEVVREARIDIAGEKVAGIPVRCLTRRHCFAEKFLANADRGLDESTLSRDAVDLAHMIEGWSRQDADAGLALATAAYGDAISRSLGSVIAKLREDRAYRNRCIEGLEIVDPDVLTAGLRELARI